VDATPFGLTSFNSRSVPETIMECFAKSILWAVALLAVCAPVLNAQSETMMYDHVHMAASDPQAAAQWYLDHFGGEGVDGRDGRLLLGTTRFIWRQAEDRRGSAGSVIDHLGFSFADLDAKLRELEVAGATITTPRRDVEGLFPLSFVEDPWGVRLEIIEDPQHLGFHHIHLRSPEPETALQWYLDKFGGVRTPLRGRRDGILYPGNVWLLVTRGETFPSTEGAIDHLGWRALDLIPKLEELRGKRVEITRGPNDLTFENGQISFFFVSAPSGASVEIVQRAANMR
jgi:catechol 2,3-dioxygenase-like lactoylglutathione lyase family enzyme